jgi:hypothetical protein
MRNEQLAITAFLLLIIDFLREEKKVNEYGENY